MKIDRHKRQEQHSALERISFCLDQIEKAPGFVRKIDWSSEIVKRCTVEEIIGALVSAEQELTIMNGMGFEDENV
jgi:hypothetical protein